MTPPPAEFPVKGVPYGEVEEPMPRVLTPAWVAAALGVAALGLLFFITVLGGPGVCPGLAIGLIVLAVRFQMVGGYDQKVVPRIWVRPEGVEVAEVGRHAVTYRYVPWHQVAGFSVEAADAIWETGSQVYVQLSTADPGSPEWLRIGAVTADFPAAVRHYSAGLHTVA